MRSTKLVAVLLAAPLVCLLAGVFFYFLPPVHARLAWRVDNLVVQVKRAINPPEEVVFVPQEQVDAIVHATLTALAPSPTASPTVVPGPSQTSLPSPTPTITPTPIPASAALTGVVHEYQRFNNCGPANLSMTLTFWGWQGDQRDTAAFMRPGEYDKNVMPGEMVAYVESQTDMQALARAGGDLETLKRFIAAGFPVIIEEGHDPPDDDWMGHYLTVTAYDDAQARIIAQDSLIMPDFPRPYEDFTLRWRDFNFVYVVVYPPEREAEVMAILGHQADETENYRYAAELARQEIGSLSGRDQYFALFNLGSNLVALGDWAGAAQAYDQAFALYPTIPEQERPWRMLWYQVGPYAAYYHTGRYQDVIDLADTTFFALGEYTLEESFYWRGLAKEALGDQDGAVFDLRRAAELNANYGAPRDELRRMGVEVP